MNPVRAWLRAFADGMDEAVRVVVPRFAVAFTAVLVLLILVTRDW